MGYTFGMVSPLVSGIVARTSNGAQGNYVLQAIEQPVHYGLSGEMLFACMVHATDGV